MQVMKNLRRSPTHELNTFFEDDRHQDGFLHKLSSSQAQVPRLVEKHLQICLPDAKLVDGEHLPVSALNRWNSALIIWQGYARYRRSAPFVPRPILELEADLEADLERAQNCVALSIGAFENHLNASQAIQEIWECCNRPALAGAVLAGQLDGLHSEIADRVRLVVNDLEGKDWLLPQASALRNLWQTQSGTLTVDDVLRPAKAVHQLAISKIRFAIDEVNLNPEAAADLTKACSVQLGL